MENTSSVENIETEYIFNKNNRNVSENTNDLGRLKSFRALRNLDDFFILLHLDQQLLHKKHGFLKDYENTSWTRTHVPIIPCSARPPVCPLHHRGLLQCVLVADA